MPKVYSYARFSTPEQAAGDSFRRQTDAARKWASDRGFELDERLSFSDEGVSAYRGTNANEDRGLGQFLFACQRGLIERGSTLLVENLDRLSRAEPLAAQHQFMGVVLQGITIVTLHDGQVYSQERMAQEPWALIAALMVAIRANEESKTKGRRVAAAWEAKRAALRAGDPKRFSLRAPAWLIPSPGGGWQVNEERAAIVRRIYAMTLAGTGEHKIAETLNREGVAPFGRGTFWHRSAICKFLQSSTVIGTLTPGRLDFSDGTKKRVTEEPVPGVYPVIVSEADWLAVRAMKDGSSTAVRGRHAQAGVAHILAGLAKCPDCGAAMIRVMKGNPAKAGRPKLVCSAAKVGAGCPYVSVPVHQVEDAILQHWGALFESVPAGDNEGSLDAEYNNLAAVIAGTEDHLRDLADALEGAPSGAGAIRLQRVEAELRTMRADLVSLDERRAYADRGIIHTRLGVMGGIQPDRLKTLLFKSDDDGLLARLVPIWPEPVRLHRPGLWTDEALLERVLDRLLSLDMLADEHGGHKPMFVPLTEDAQKLMDDFRLAVRRWEDGAEGLLLSFIGKLPGLAARLSLVLCCLDWASEDDQPPHYVEADHFARAANLVGNYMLPMARRAYADASVPQAERSARRLVAMIREMGWQSFTTRQAMKLERAGLATAAELDPALSLLEDADCVRHVEQPAKPQGGRPSRLYIVNPALLIKG